MEGALLAILSELLTQAITQYAKWEIKRKFNSAGKAISEFYALIDNDGDGVAEHEELVFSFDVSVPQYYNGYTIVNNGDEIGLGYPEFEIIDANEFASRISNHNDGTITATDDYYIVDNDVYFPIPVDYDLDGHTDWGMVIDENQDGIPDASPDGPFYPVGSDEYNKIIGTIPKDSEGGVDLVVVSPEGEIAVYDRNGNVKSEDVDTAYATWVNKNGIMNKKLDDYSVSEGLLLLLLLISGCFFIRGLFRRKDVFR